MNMERFLYLGIDVLTILFPFVFSFYPKANFSHKWKYLWPAILLPAVLFIAWDVWFTSMGVWGFNPRYLTGIYLFNLPIEEILFFICIPYACVFTYEAVNHFTTRYYLQNYHRAISISLCVILLAGGLLNLQKWYTSSTFVITSVFLSIHLLLRSNFLGRFYFAFVFILIPFFLVNGVLTGTGIDQEVVWYNNAENLGWRMGTIPFEDTFYGFTLLLMNVSVFEWLQRRSAVPKR